MNPPERALSQASSELDVFCERWCLDNSQSRNAERIAASMDDIRAFYDAATMHAESALNHLSTLQLGALSEQDGNLLRLMLSLAEVGPAVEWFNQPRVRDGCDESHFPLVIAIPDLEGQETLKPSN
jgi:hypothetical protein